MFPILLNISYCLQKLGFIREAKSLLKIATFFHGTSTETNIGHMLLPPIETNKISEKGRKKRLDKVFFTEDLGSAKIYAKRAVNQFGGYPIVYRVIPMGEIKTLQDKAGTTVFYTDWAFVEPIN